jgi:hypothetical protein
MNDDQLRALVRDAVARHLGASGSGAGAPAPPPEMSPAGPRYPQSPWAKHASHALYVSLVNVDSACVIEPSVPCDHCGYCKSHGH